MKNNFRENLSKLRKLKGFSQAELAEKIDASVQSICHYESGRREPKVSTLIRLAEALEVSVDELTRGNIEVVASAP